MKNPLNIRARLQESAALDRELDLSISGDWLQRIPEPALGEPELTAEEVARHMPLLTSRVAEAIQGVRDGTIEGWVMVDSASEGLPPSFWEGVDPDAIIEEALRWEETAELRARDPAGLTPNTRARLESGGPAALALLACFEGRDGDPDAIQAIMDQRAKDAGLGVEFARRDSGFMIGSGPRPF